MVAECLKFISVCGNNRQKLKAIKAMSVYITAAMESTAGSGKTITAMDSTSMKAVDVLDHCRGLIEELKVAVHVNKT